jgi:RES domain-containing protein
MSSSIWTRCGGSSNRRRLEAKPWRIVEAQHSSSTWKLVDSQAEHDVLEELIEGSKPRLLPAPEFEGLHWLLFTPFRYPPREHGSRFGRRDERAIWYGSDALRTALAEDAYYRLVFFAGTAAKLAPHRVARSAFQAAVRTDAGIDLSAAPFAAHAAQLTSPSDYSATQRLGSAMRKDGVEAFRFTSARDPGQGTNVALFSPRAFAAKAPLGVSQTWHCTVTTSGDVAFDHEAMGGVERVFFRRADFLVDGALLAPAP